MGSRTEPPEPQNYLRAWREFRGMTQAQLAEIVGTGGCVISLLESGERGLSDKWLRRLAPPLGTSPGMLLSYHPDNIGQAVLDVFLQVPEERRAKVVASLPKELPRPVRHDGAPGQPPESVVTLPKPARKPNVNRISKADQFR